jgi:hydrogenase maturation protease
MSHTLVLGLGSPLMGDDGVGLCALEALRRVGSFTPEPEWVDGGTWGMNLLPLIEAADCLLLLDAIRAGGPPGTRVLLPRDALPRGLGMKLSPHQIDLQEVLALAELRGSLPARAVAIGLEPVRVELGWGLSDEIRAGLDGLVAAAVDQLADWGHGFHPIPRKAIDDVPCVPADRGAELIGLSARRFDARGPGGL